VRERLRKEAGFGLIELLMAMVMLNIGILALVATFSSAATALARANKYSNASTLADTQMELFRGMKWTSILQDCAEFKTAIADSSYTADSAYQTNLKPAASSPYWVAPKAPVGTVTTTGCTTSAPWPAATASATCTPSGSPSVVPIACDPSRLVTGADGRSYRIDTYLYYDQPANGGQIKVVSVVVRDAAQTSRSMARLTSTFDPSTGQ
jgi:type II secretory pathway pseudopilin PulG